MAQVDAGTQLLRIFAPQLPLYGIGIVLTGVLGNMIAEGVCRLFGIEHPIAKGVGIGTASHAIGTSRAMMMGEVEGAMSSLSIVVAGVMTVLGAGIFANFL